jgi:hypothetical protein
VTDAIANAVEAHEALLKLPKGGKRRKAEAAKLDDMLSRLTAAELNWLLHYVVCRENGCTPRLADMLAEGQPPMSNTDREFLEGHCCGNQFAKNTLDMKVGDAFKKQAAAAGVNVTGKVYLGGMARFPGDPEAWVSDRHEVQKRLTERGWGSEGSVMVKPKHQPVKRQMRLPSLLAGGAKKQIFARLKAKGVSGDLLTGGQP